MNQIIIDGTDFHAEKMFVLIECLTYSGSAFGVNEKGEGVFFNARIIKKMKLSAGDMVNSHCLPNYPDKRIEVPWRCINIANSTPSE
jgi:hypothetical protein